MIFFGASKDYQGYYWKPKMGQNSIMSPFFARRAKKPRPKAEALIVAIVKIHISLKIVNISVFIINTIMILITIINVITQPSLSRKDLPVSGPGK